MRHFDYRPDIVLLRRGKKTIIEIALREDWRSIVGELVLAKAAGASEAAFIVYDWDEDFFANLIPLMAQVIQMKDWHYLILDDDDLSNPEIAKGEVGEALEEWKIL